MRCFIDTNILVYLRDRRSPAKTEQATVWVGELSDHEGLVVSPQVINEFTAVLTRKLKMFSLAEVEPMVAEIGRWCDAPLTFETSTLAFGVHERFGFAWWDSLIVASALQSNCDLLLSEDMSHGQRMGPLMTINPFLVRPDEILSQD
ncbi:PIN domain-containing protein [Methylopila sp. Yamaguchi]|uniref:PIN domain-containing protein n=1 Tax=Methylopila sp. Yamaguchi TaxID=1437817 RepID=UPI000CBCB05C|nr:PIN domain-containing protein [Methylopila sp. Yamaguchi]GBD49690.1 PilT domain-containing protein [Methylopila sp. Yamaguchi]